MANSIRILQAEHRAVEDLGLDHGRLLELMQSVYEQIETVSAYKSIILPIKDEKLEEACRIECRKKVYMGAAQCTQQHISYRQTPFAGSD